MGAVVFLTNTGIFSPATIVNDTNYETLNLPVIKQV